MNPISRNVPGLIGGAALAILAIMTKLVLDHIASIGSDGFWDVGLVPGTVFVIISTFRFRRPGGLFTLFFISIVMLWHSYQPIHLIHPIIIDRPLLVRFILTNLFIVFSVAWALDARQIAEVARESLANSNAKLKHLIHAAAELQSVTNPADIGP